MYCEIALLDPRASAELATHAKAQAASRHFQHPQCLRLPSREVFEFLNDNLGSVLVERHFSALDIQAHARRLDPW